MSGPTDTGATTLQVRHTFEAGRDAVFDAWTDPEQVRQWWQTPDASTASVEMDARVGGDYRIAMTRGEFTVNLVGTYLEVEAPERLVYTFRWDPPALQPMNTGETLVTVEFRELGSETEVVLVHEKLQGDEIREFHQFGWTTVMSELAELLAG